MKPKRLQTLAELRALQKLVVQAVMQPVGRDLRARRGSPIAAEVTRRNKKSNVRLLTSAATEIPKIIKPNARLTSFERFEIYHRQYWFRVMDCFAEDFAGVRAVLGEQRFHDLAVAYISSHPSRSFTLRNLGSRLVEFMQSEQKLQLALSPCLPRSGGEGRGEEALIANTHVLVGEIKSPLSGSLPARPSRREREDGRARADSPNSRIPRITALALDMARLEWAHIEAFDNAAKRPITPADLQGRSAAQIHLRMQPHLTLLKLGHPLDNFLIRLRENTRLRGEASNAIEDDATPPPMRAPRLPKRRTICLAVHRYKNIVHYKRLQAAQYNLLLNIQKGASLEDALKALPASGKTPPVGKWFADWAALGWFWTA